MLKAVETPKDEPLARGEVPPAETRPMPSPAAKQEPVEFKPVAKEEPAPKPEAQPAAQAKAEPEEERSVPKLKLGGRPSGGDSDELSLDSSPRGRFEGEDPNVVDGEDLDLPPFLRKKK